MRLSGLVKFSPIFYIKTQNGDGLSDGEYLSYIIAQIDNGVPVGVDLYVAGEGWRSGMIDYIPSEAEIKESCSPTVGSLSTVKECGSHGIVVTGYDNNKRLIYFKNSWDESWGLNSIFSPVKEKKYKTGYGAISYDYLAKFRLDNLVTLSQ